MIYFVQVKSGLMDIKRFFAQNTPNLKAEFTRKKKKIIFNFQISILLFWLLYSIKSKEIIISKQIIWNPAYVHVCACTYVGLGGG